MVTLFAMHKVDIPVLKIVAAIGLENESLNLIYCYSD